MSRLFSAAEVVFDAVVWLGFVWLGFILHQHFQVAQWALPAFLTPATLYLWVRIDSSIGELAAIVVFLLGAGLFLFVSDKMFSQGRDFADFYSYVVCAAASLAGFRTWHPHGWLDRDRSSEVRPTDFS
jgi:hypothetical protein